MKNAFLSRSRRVVGLAGVLLALLWAPAAVQACAVCFGDPDSDLSRGLNAGVLALLLVVFVVLAGLAAFFVHVARRSSASGKAVQTAAAGSAGGGAA